MARLNANMSDEFLAIGKKEGIKIPRHKQKWSRLAQNILKTGPSQQNPRPCSKQ
jgi:hypothetical protein